MTRKNKNQPSSFKKPYPDDGTIYTTWLTVKQAELIMNMSGSAIRLACDERRLRSKKFGGKRRGEWRIDPVAAKKYQRRNTSA